MQPPIRVLFVCLGNICRSPMAEGLFTQRVADRGLSDRFAIDSAGTGAWHEGERPDPRTQEVLRRHGAPVIGRARQVRASDYVDFDYIFAMDRSNLEHMWRRCPAEHRDKLKLVLEPLGRDDVPDPYYGGPGGFDTVHGLLDEALERWLERMLA